MPKYLLLMVSMILLPQSLLADLNKLRFITEEYPPYNYVENDTVKGLAVDLLEQAFLMTAEGSLARENIEVLPWARGYETTLQTPNSVLFSTTRTETRESLFHWVGPISKDRVVLMARKSSGITLDSIESINETDLQIAVIHEDVGAHRLQELGVDSARVRTAMTNFSALSMLSADRVDLWAYSEDVAFWLMDSHGFDKTEFESVYTLSEADLYFALNLETDPALVSQLQQAVDMAKGDHSRLRFVTEEYPPFNYLDDKGEVRGVATDMLQSLMQHTFLEAEFHILPWARALTEAEMLENTCVFSTARNADREDKFKWIGPIVHNQWGAFSLASSTVEADSLEDLNTLRVGSFRQSGIANYLTNAGYSLILATTDNENIHRLSSDLIDVWVTGVAAAQHIANQQNIELKKLFIFNEIPLYLACHVEFPVQLQQYLQTTLENIQNEQVERNSTQPRDTLE